MKLSKKGQKEIKYERIMRVVDKAEKEALKFIRKNMRLDPQLQIKYL